MADKDNMNQNSIPEPEPPAGDGGSDPAAAENHYQRMQDYLMVPDTDVQIDLVSWYVGLQFNQDIQNFSKNNGMTTGYRNLDVYQRFYPGLYVLGAVPGLGKTTYLTQMADQLAAMGRRVIYFSLEQSAFELTAKALTRQFFIENEIDRRRANNRPWCDFGGRPAPTVMDIRCGVASAAYPAELARYEADYASVVGDRLITYAGAFSLTIEQIMRLIDNNLQAIPGSDQQAPIIMIDYLQIIAPTPDEKGRIPEPRTAIDHIIHAIKAYQLRRGLTIILVSSFNRANYSSVVDFESFKESGGIEYTADVIWGLQLAILDNPEYSYYYDKDGKRKGEKSLIEKRQMINNAKAQQRREVNLVCLKNRYGQTYTVQFDYFPAYDCFLEPMGPQAWCPPPIRPQAPTATP